VDLTRPAAAVISEQFLEAMPDGVVVTDAEGRIVLANGQMQRLSGYAREELLGMSIEQLVPEALRDRHRVHRVGYQGSPVPRAMGGHLDIRFRRRDGTEFPADIALSTVQTDQGQLAVASVRDITERKRAEAELLQAEERFRLVVEGVRDHGVFMLDRDGSVSSWSPAAARISGYQADEIVGRHFSVFYPEADVVAGRPERELAEARATGRYREEGWRLRRDGSRYWADIEVAPIRDAAGELVGYAKITRDATERKRQDDRLRAVLDVADAALKGGDEPALLQLVAARARSLVSADLGLVLLADEESGGLVVAAADGEGREAIRGHRSPEAEAVLAAAGGGPSIVVRLGTGERDLGSLAVTNVPGVRGFTEADRALLEAFALQAAVDIDYAGVRDELQRLAVLDDRERIGRELHDGAIQALFAVGIDLQSMAAIASDVTMRGRLVDTVKKVDGVVRDLRSYIYGLRPGIAADRQLGKALRELAEQFEAQHGVACAVRIDESVAAKLAGRAPDIVQVVREGLSNVARHAAATTCRLMLRAQAEGALLEIDDDGRGFTDTASTSGGGWGMRNLRERATAMGGSLEVRSVPGEGTTIQLRIPI
jgi:PAS domain S-box-containing protein